MYFLVLLIIYIFVIEIQYHTIMKKYILSLLSILILISYSCKKEEEAIPKDNVAPVITLKGDSITQLKLGVVFTDSGYTATDNIDGDISSKVVVTGNVNPSVSGVYKLHYNVSDKAGNKAIEKTRTITVIARSLKPNSIQNGFAITYTATWEQYSGVWGAIRLHQYATDAPHGAIIAAHVSGDPMSTKLTNSFLYDRYHGGGIPAFYVGDDKTSYVNAMNLLLCSTSNCGIDYQYFITGDSMYVHTKTKFFSSMQGDFYLSVLVLEDGINGNSNAPVDYIQNGTSNSYPNDDYFHDFVLRASSVKDSAYGEIIVQNPIQNTEINKNYTIRIDNNWIKPYPVCIVWKHVIGTKPEYHYINALKRKNDALKSW